MRLSMKRKGTDFGGKKGIWEIKDRMHAQSPSSTQALSYIDFACAASCFGKTTGAGIERRGIFRQLKRNGAVALSPNKSKTGRP